MPTGETEENWTQKIVGEQTRRMIYTSQFDLFLSIVGLIQCEFTKWNDPEAYIIEEHLVLI